jgi:ABC-type Fe3+-citrate transport system substrate-binding protein
MVEMMNAIEAMDMMFEEGQEQIAEHKRVMAEAQEALKQGKMPKGVGPRGPQEQ